MPWLMLLELILPLLTALLKLFGKLPIAGAGKLPKKTRERLAVVLKLVGKVGDEAFRVGMPLDGPEVTEAPDE